MRRIILILAAAVLVGASSGCAVDKRRLATVQLISTVNEITDVFSKIKDPEGARLWKPKLKELEERAKAAVDILKKEDAPTESESLELKQDFEDDIKLMGAHLATQIARIQADPAIREVLTTELNGQKYPITEFKMEPPRKPGKPGEGGPGMPGQGNGPPKPPGG